MRSPSALPGSTLPLTPKQADQEGSSSPTGSDFSDCHLIFKRTKWKGERSSHLCFHSHQTCKISSTETAADAKLMQERQITTLMAQMSLCGFSQDSIFYLLRMHTKWVNILGCHPSYL